MLAAVFFTTIDWVVLCLYFVGILLLGLICWRRNQSADQFTAGGRTLAGWLCGLSIFATYLSSISYLALPGKAFTANWNPFAYSLALPIAALIAVRLFLPLYRAAGGVSAYALFEDRFGLWARLFASSFYLLFQIARIGVVMYLMALPMAVLFGWDIRLILLGTGVIVTVYALIGGIVAVIWADAIQAVVLLAGALLALALLLLGIDGGATGVFSLATEENKFSLGSTNLLDWSSPTLWVILAFGLFDNLRNFGVDQSYIQRYISARSDRDAARSVWLGVWLYVPVSALFLFLGSALYAYYQTHPELLTEVQQIVAEQKLLQAGVSEDDPRYAEEMNTAQTSLKPAEVGDRVFPHFIASQLPVGIRGLLIAAIFAAAMSTVSTSLNSSATLIMSDFYARLLNKSSTDRQQLNVLRLATMVWGILGTGMALLLVRLTQSVLDIWWLLSGALGAGLVGLFLTGLVLKRVQTRHAGPALAAAMAIVAWMTVSRSKFWQADWIIPSSPLHENLAIVVGPLAMIGLAWLLLLTTNRRNSHRDNVGD